MKKLLNNERGWLLVDSLIAIVIVSFALVSLAGAYRQVSITATSANNYARALHLAQETVEDLKGLEELSSYTLPPTATITRDNFQYTVTVTDQPVTALQSNTKIKPIRVNVAWTEAGSPSIDVYGYIYLK